MNSWARSACLGVLAVLYLTGCMKGPNPWSPKTYPGELGRYERWLLAPLTARAPP